MKTGNNMKTYVVAGILLTFSFYLLPVKAANLWAQSTIPYIYFDDINGPSPEWRLLGDQNFFGLYNYDTARNVLWFDDLANMQLDMQGSNFQIQDQNGTTIARFWRDAPLSLDIRANGDVSLAGGDVFIDTSLNRVGIGTSIPSSDLSIKSTAPGIYRQGSFVV